MKITFAEINVNPLVPVKQAGFAQQVNKIFEFHDDLHARILGLEDEKTILYFISIDSLGVPVRVEMELSLYFQKKSTKKVAVTISATHDHFAGDARDEIYQQQLLGQLTTGIEALTWKELSKPSLTHQHVFFDGVGHSRISSHPTDKIFLDLISFYDDETKLGTAIVYNCHPTIHNGETPYFTSEYPGYVIKKLQEKYPNEFFTFFQSAAGDVSTRFTRPSQDYAGVEYLGNKLVKEILELRKEETKKLPLGNLSFTSENLPLEHDLGPIDYSKMPKVISEREKSEIKTGEVAREHLLAHPDRLEKTIMISCAVLGGVKMVFGPKEMFSYYLGAIDPKKAVLICYSNGYSPYIVDVGFSGVTYELFTDTTTEETKKNLYALLKKYGH